jgi:hypothetical protein
MESTNQKKTTKLHKPNNALTVPVKDSLSFFKWWCIFLRPFINLTNREIDVISEFLKQRWELSKVISDQTVLDTMVMNDATKKKVIDACHITKEHFYVVMSNLRKNGVINGNIINPRLIPNIRQDDNGCFQLLILFKSNELQ